MPRSQHTVPRTKSRKRSLVRSLALGSMMLTLGCTDASPDSAGGAPRSAVQAPRTASVPWPSQTLASGNNHVCVIGSDGSVSCWGTFSSRIGDVTSSPTRIDGLFARSVMASWMLTCAEMADASGTVCWGDATEGRLVLLEGSRLMSLAAVSGATVYLANSEGELVAWGSNFGGTAGDGTVDAIHENASWPFVQQRTVRLERGSVRALSAGGAAACAVTHAGQLWCWGRNSAGVLAPELQASSSPRPGERTFAPPLSAIALGGGHACGVTAEGGVVCWGGARIDHEIHDSGPGRWRLPVVTRIPLPLPAVSLASGPMASCAILTSRELWCWGRAPGTSPARYFGTGWLNAVHCGTDAQNVVVGMGHVCYRKVDGTLFCFGTNDAGALGTHVTASDPPGVRIDL